MYITMFAVLFTSRILLTSAELKQNDEQNVYVNQLIESYEKKMEEDLANLKSQLLNYLDTIDKTDCLTSGKSCASLYKSGERKDGVYTIDPDGLGSFQVRCDMQTNGGGWTVLQRRQDASVNFYRGWEDYKNGFGDLSGNFWLGLDEIHRLSNSGQNVLRVDLMDFDNTTAYAKYGNFSVASESESYRLDVGNYSGNANDSLGYHNGMKFSTYDKDNDRDSGNCAKYWKSAWWYKRCHYSNLNGQYLGADQRSANGIIWQHWKDDKRSMKKTEMKIRSAQF